MIGAEDFYRDIAGDVETWFDTSEFDASHPSGIQTSVNKKVIGMMKDGKRWKNNSRVCQFEGKTVFF